MVGVWVSETSVARQFKYVRRSTVGHIFVTSSVNSVKYEDKNIVSYTTYSLLTGCVPDLKLDSVSVNRERL